MTNQTTTRVWVEDQNPVLRMGLVACVEAAGLTIAGQSTGVLPEPSAVGFDVVLFHLTTDRLRWSAGFGMSSSAGLIAVTDEANGNLAAEALRHGCSGVLVRDEITAQTLAACVGAVLAGRASLATALLPDLVSQVDDRPFRPGWQRLTEREVDVLRLVSEGKSLRSIAEALSYSEKTIKTVIHDVVVRTGCRNRSEAVAMAARERLI